MRTSTSIIVASLFVSGLAVIACAKAPDETLVTDTPKTEPTPDAGATKKKDGGTSSSALPSPGTKKDGGGSGDSTPSDPPPSGGGAGQCGGSADFNTCIDCCSTAHQTGSDTFYGTLIDCLCQSSHCATECGQSLCDPSNPTQPDATCDACIKGANGSSACQTDVQSACSADPDCVAFDQCVTDSDCASKP